MINAEIYRSIQSLVRRENMNDKYRNQIKKIFPVPDEVLNRLISYISLKEVPAGTILLWAGDISTKALIVLKGCLRQYYIKDNGADITAQFFIEGQMVASFESAFMKKPSRSFIETIEDSTIGRLKIEILEKMKTATSHSLVYFNRFLESPVGVLYEPARVLYSGYTGRKVFEITSRKSRFGGAPAKTIYRLISGNYSRIPFPHQNQNQKAN